MAKPAKTQSAVSSTSAPYLGQHVRGLDHGRVILPSEWRLGGSAVDFMLVLWPLTSRDYLLVLPPSRWEVIRKHLEELSITDDQVAVVERLIGVNSFSRSLDRYGRLPLPEDASRAVGIGKEAMLVGRMDKFEVWNPARFAATLANPDAQRIADVIKTMRI